MRPCRWPGVSSNEEVSHGRVLSVTHSTPVSFRHRTCCRLQEVYSGGKLVFHLLPFLGIFCYHLSCKSKARIQAIGRRRHFPFWSGSDFWQEDNNGCFCDELDSCCNLKRLYRLPCWCTEWVTRWAKFHPERKGITPLRSTGRRGRNKVIFCNNFG